MRSEAFERVDFTFAAGAPIVANNAATNVAQILKWWLK